MSVRTMARQDDATFPDGAICPLEYAKERVVTVETYQHRVLSLREANGYNDSDFYALVWDDEQGKPIEVMYASTRGWTYPCGASVDADEETLAKYQAHLEREHIAYMAQCAAWEARKAKKGRRVRFVRATRNKAVGTIPAGTQGEVFWYGEAREFGAMPRGGYKEHSRGMRGLMQAHMLGDPNEGKRCGVQLPDGTRVFVNATALEVIV